MAVIRGYPQVAGGEVFGYVKLEEHPGNNGRSPRLIVRLQAMPSGQRHTWMPEHDDLFVMLAFYRQHDREWPRLKRLVQEILDGGSMPVWDPARYRTTA